MRSKIFPLLVVFFLVGGIVAVFALYDRLYAPYEPATEIAVKETQQEETNDVPYVPLPVATENIAPVAQQTPKQPLALPSVPTLTAAPTPVVMPEPTKPASPSASVVIAQKTTFAAQAPLGEWSDPRQQDGCEEASALIAIKAMRGESFTLQEAKDETLAASDYELTTYGSYHDTSARDTAERILKGYFGYDNFIIKERVAADDIIDAISRGYLVIAPMNGQLLQNPFYTPPGPARHMLVVKGYDFATNEFITDDVGTRRGANFRYDKDHFYESIRDYPTGAHEPVGEIIEKNIIIVMPEI